MLSFIADVAGAYFVARKARGWGASLLLCLLVGLTTAAAMSLVNSVAVDGSFDLGKILHRMAVGAIYHPVIALVAWFLWSARRTTLRPPTPNHPSSTPPSATDRPDARAAHR